VNPSASLSLLQNSTASYHVTISTGLVGAFAPELKNEGLTPVTDRYWACVTSYFPILNPVSVTVWTGRSSSNPPDGDPIWKLPPGTATMGTLSVRPGIERSQPAKNMAAIHIPIDTTMCPPFQLHALLPARFMNYLPKNRIIFDMIYKFSLRLGFTSAKSQ
jgi:hypothetical protein